MSDARMWMDKLNDMSVPDIRALMVAENITGISGDPFRCPIAQLLRAKDADLTFVSVGCGSVQWATGDKCTTVRTSSTVHQFIIAFDHGYYPELKALNPPQSRPLQVKYSDEALTYPPTHWAAELTESSQSPVVSLASVA